MSRVTYTEKQPGDSRDGGWLTTFYTDLRTATGALDRDNVREEGILRRQVKNAPAYAPFTAVTNDNAGTVATQAWGPLPGAYATRWTGTITLKPNDMLRVRGSMDCPSTVANYGIPSLDEVELRIGGTVAGVAWSDQYSEVWHRPGQQFDGLAAPTNIYSSNGLATFATYHNDDPVNDVTITMLELQAKITSAVLVRVGYMTLQAMIFRKVT
mgnify:CR=1 FL=1